MHNTIVGAEKLIANLQGGKKVAHKSRTASRANMVAENMDLLKVCSLAWQWRVLALGTAGRSWIRRALEASVCPLGLSDGTKLDVPGQH